MGGVSVIPAGRGFAVGYHQATVNLELAPTSLQVVLLDGAGKPLGKPRQVLTALTHAPGPAALAADGNGVYAGAVISGSRSDLAQVMALPLP